MNSSHPGDPATASDDAVQSVLTRGSVYSLVTLIQAATTLLAIPILTRSLDADQYGTLTTALVAQAVITHLCGFGMPAAISRTYFREHGPGGARALLVVAAGLALAVTIFALALGPLWSQVFESLDFDTLLVLATVSAGFGAVLVSAQVLLQAEGRVAAFVVSAAVGTGGGQVLGIAGAVLDHGPTGYLVGLTTGFALGMLYAWSAAGFDIAPLRRGRGARRLVGTALSVGVPTIGVSLSLYLLSAADRVVVERVEGLPAAGAYYIAYALGSLGIFLVTAINGAWSPAIFGAEEEGRWGFFADSAVQIIAVAAWVAAALSIVAPIGLRVMAPADYDVAGLGAVSAIVAVSTLPYVWYLSRANIAIWEARTRPLAVMSAVAVVVNLGLCAWLVPAHGLEGAAIATLAAYLILAVAAWLFTRTLVSIPWDRIALLRAASPALLAFALALLLPEDGAWLVVRGILGVAAGGVALHWILGRGRTLGAPEAA